MKCSRFLVLPLLFLLLILISGCSSSGGGDGGDFNEDKGTAPTITDINFYKCDDPEKSNPVESYSYSFEDYYYREVYCNDPDLDIRYIHWMVYRWQNGQYVEDYGPEVTEFPTQSDEFAFYENINARLITAAPNSYRHDFQLEDNEGNMSNTFRVIVTVD